jgi:hypothetical protein
VGLSQRHPCARTIPTGLRSSAQACGELAHARCASGHRRAVDLRISVGDVDRGPQPLEVIDLFRMRARSLVLMGNHERKVFSYLQQITRL